MIELYDSGYIHTLKKRRAIFRVGYVLLLCIFTAGYVLSITAITKEWLTMLIGILGVLVVTSYYLALLAPIRVVFKMLREAKQGLQTKEVLTFVNSDNEEIIREALSYYKYSFYGKDEKGVIFKRELLLDKTFDPLNLVKDREYELETFQGILLRYTSTKN